MQQVHLQVYANINTEMKETVVSPWWEGESLSFDTKQVNKGQIFTMKL